MENKQTAQELINSVEKYGVYSPEDWEKLKIKVQENEPKQKLESFPIK